jgi:GNAT superfamily N-acetyltransferase
MRQEPGRAISLPGSWWIWSRTRSGVFMVPFDRMIRMHAFRLTTADAARYARIRERMLHEAPWAFAATVADDPLLRLPDLQRVLAEEKTAIFAVEGPPRAEGDIPPDLVSVASITRAGQPQYAHRSRIWGVYVEPQHRGRGFGRLVLNAAIDQARQWQGVDFVDIAVSANSPEARLLYASCGFLEWGREPEATVHRGERFDESYMARRL